VFGVILRNMAWYTYTVSGPTAAVAPEQALDRLWKTSLFRSSDVCLFAGEVGPLGKRYYLAVSELAEDLLQDYKLAQRATPLRETPSENVVLLVGQEQRAWELWGEQTACDPTSLVGCEMCSG